jgi:anti-anti-sigma factor
MHQHRISWVFSLDNLEFGGVFADNPRRLEQGSMEIGEKRQNGVSVLLPIGSIDNDTSLDFQVKVLASLDVGLAALVDFSGVDFISSAGVAVLVKAAKEARAKNRRIVLAAPRPMVSEIFAISRLSRVMAIYRTAEEGIAALQS